MHGLKRERLENQEIQGSLEQLGGLWRHIGFLSTFDNRGVLFSSVGCQQEQEQRYCLDWGLQAAGSGSIGVKRR